MGSTRLPGKVLLDLAGKPMLARMVERLRRCRRIGLVVVATTTKSEDDVIEDLCRSEGWAWYRGSEDDVLDRYYRAAAAFQAESVVRVTSDCPLIDPGVVDRVIERFQAGECDYAANTRLEVSYPNGLDTEVFSFTALERAWREARWRSEREHVTPYIWKNPGLFSLCTIAHDRDLSGLRWTVDEPADLEFVREVFRELGDRPFEMEDVLELLERRPELRTVNAHLTRDAGYAKSLAEDRPVMRDQ